MTDGFLTHRDPNFGDHESIQAEHSVQRRSI
jgi:hypothetical protein